MLYICASLPPLRGKGEFKLGRMGMTLLSERALVGIPMYLNVVTAAQLRGGTGNGGKS